MKIALIGAGGVRTPLLLRGICEHRSVLPVSEVALFDPAVDRMQLLEPVCRAILERAGNPCRLERAASMQEAVEGATFIVTSIRAGGIAARRTDERFLLDHGLLGQETCGAAGFAKALRTIPPMIEIARAAATRAPLAWIVNFTNPVGIVTEAVIKSTRARIIGICDTPLELYEGIAQVLETPLAQLHCDYFGLNHLGWVKRVLKSGEDVLPILLRDSERVQRVYRHKLFSSDLIRSLGVLPSEYLYYYYSTEAAIAGLRKAGKSRAEEIEARNESLWSDLASTDRPLEGHDAYDAYESYLAARNASYMASETNGTAGTARDAAYATAAGYERMALAVMLAIWSSTGAVLPVAVANCGTIAGLEDDDVVEVPSVLGSNGALPLAVGPPPASVAELLSRVKTYERLTVKAALSGSADMAVEALAANPLVANRAQASELVAAFRGLHPELLGYLQ